MQAVGLLSILSLGLFIIRVAFTGVTNFLFVPENLLLTWLGLIISWVLVEQLKTQSWLSWRNILLSVLWIFFLPNSWYVLTDFIHVFPTGEISQLYDIVLVSTLVLVGFTVGFTSLYMVHRELQKRLSLRESTAAAAAIILLSSFAIYLGRDLRWNSWDVIKNPSGIILNVSDRIIDPLGYPRSLNVTGLFFVLLSTLYIAIWIFIHPHAPKKK